MTGGQAQMSVDLGDDRGIYNGSDDLQGATAVGADFNVDIEFPFVKTLPGFHFSGRR